MTKFEFAKRIREILDGRAPQLSQMERNRLIAVVIGRALSVQLLLPTSPVVSVDAYFYSNHEVCVEDLLSAINEVMVIDTKLVREVTFRFYKFRYDLCYGSAMFLSAFTELAPLVPGLLPAAIADQPLVLTDDTDRLLENCVYAFKNQLNPETRQSTEVGITSPLAAGVGV